MPPATRTAAAMPKCSKAGFSEKWPNWLTKSMIPPEILFICRRGGRSGRLQAHCRLLLICTLWKNCKKYSVNCSSIESSSSWQYAYCLQLLLPEGINDLVSQLGHFFEKPAKEYFGLRVCNVVVVWTTVIASSKNHWGPPAFVGLVEEQCSGGCAPQIPFRFFYH